MKLNRKCRECGSTRKGDVFTDGTGYECPDCMSNVFYADGTEDDETREGPRLFSRPSYAVGRAWR